MTVVEYTPLDAESLHRLAALGGAAISHMGPVRSLPPLLPLTVAARQCVGPAWPVTVSPDDLSGLAHACHDAPAGSVLVVSVEPAIDMAVVGGLSALEGVRAKLAGIVVDGYVCDLDEIDEAGMAVYARGAVAAAGSLGILQGGCRMGAVICGVQVNPGDIIVGSLDGVAVLDLVTARAALDGEADLLAREQKIKSELQSGRSLWELVCEMRELRLGGASAADGSDGIDSKESKL